MLIRVEHATGYAYSEPLVTSTQYLRMTPVSGRTQAVESWKLTCPGAVTTPWQDQYGNLCHTLTVAQPVSELEIKVCGLVRTRDTSGVVGMAPSELPSAIYLRETPYTVATTSIQDFAARFQPKLARDPIEVLHEIMMAIADAVEYRRGETHVHTTGAEALEQGSGVCQDHAHIFCAVCRALGVPARYVSGYLAHGEGHEAHAASHAWAEGFVEHLGWVSFDPTNRACATDAYIRTAIGLGQLKGGQLRLFMVYDAGNFIEAMGDTTYFQIGEVKYGKPILDRIIQRDTSLSDAAKCALISFDSTMRSNVSVGPPLDLLIYRRNSLKKDFTIRLEDDDAYLQAIRDGWGGAIHKAFHEIIHDPGWTF